MAYQEPSVIVRQQLAENTGVVVQDADQDPVIIGEAYEVFDDQVAATRYDARAGAGSQVFAWPVKKAASIVDLAGIRSDTAEPDTQLRASAVLPMVVKLKDPISLVETTLDPIVDVSAVGQSGFTISEGVAGAVARVSAANATGAESGKIRIRTGGLVNAGLKIGDKIRVVLQHVSGGPVTIQANVSSITDSEIGYTATNAPSAVVDDPTIEAVDGNAITTPGRIVSAAGGFTAGVSVGDRVAIWTESAQNNDGNGTTGNTVTTVAGLSITAADVGRKVTLGSARPGDGAVTQTNGVTNNTNTLTGTGITSAMVGRVVKISGGTGAIPATYRRVVTAGAGTLTFSGAVIPNSTGASFTIYASVVREIASVISANQFTYTGTSLADPLQVDIPVILRSKVLRDVSVVNSDNELTYSGSAVTSVTGFLVLVPFDIYKADVSYQVFPDYQLLVTYRALDTSFVDGIRVAKISEVEAIGTVSKYNPLLFAAAKGLEAMGTTDRNVLLVGINPWSEMITPSGLPGDRDVIGAYNAALEVLSNDPAAYYMAPLTFNKTVGNAFDSSTIANSLPEIMAERTCALAYELPMGEVESTTGVIEPGLDGGNKKILDVGREFISEVGITPGTQVVITSPAAFAGTYLTDAATTDDELVLTGANWAQTQEYAVANGNFDAVAGQVTSVTTGVWKDVDVGDWIVRGADFRRVSAKINNQTLSYAGVPLTGTAQSVAVIRSYMAPNEPVVYYAKPMSKSDQAEALKAVSQSRARFRTIHVWPDQVDMSVGQDQAGNEIIETLPSYYAAAILSCMMAVLPPQRSATGMSVPSIVGLKNSNTYFSREQLNTIAEGGWTILVQPNPSGNVKVRHLMSTDVSSVKRREFSVTKNVDNQSKVIRLTLEPNLNDGEGRVNITPKLLASLMLPLQGVMNFFVAENQLTVGPNGEQPYVIKGLFQDPENIDRIKANISTTQPIPGNTLDITYVI